MPGDVTGFLTDVGVKPLSGRFPRLFLRLDRPSTFGANVLVTDKYEATITDATGAFIFAGVVGSDEMLPASTYTLTADWDAGQELDVITGLRVPSTGGNISDIIAATAVAQPGTVMYGFGPPPATLTGVLYIDLNDAQMYAPGNGGI
jgi:hypothetical protein